MLIHNLIVITSNRVSHLTDRSLEDSFTLARRLNKRLVIVLGPDGDEFLRLAADLLEECEIVFDPNYAANVRAGFFSGLKAGLQACEGDRFAAYVVELGSTLPSADKWAEMDRALFQHRGDEHVLIPVTHDNGNPLGPLVITYNGAPHLLGLPAHSEWPSATVKIDKFAIHRRNASPGAEPDGQT